MTDKEKIRADVDAAMQDVEEKSKAFTEAHKGEWLIKRPRYIEVSKEKPRGI